MIAQIKQLKPQNARRETERGKEREETLKKMRLKEYDEDRDWGTACWSHWINFIMAHQAVDTKLSGEEEGGLDATGETETELGLFLD